VPQRLKNTNAQKDTVIGASASDTALADQPLTAQGGPMSITATPTAVPGASISAPALPATRSYVITYSCVLENSESATTVTARIFDGVASAGIVTEPQALAGTDTQIISWTVKVAGNGSARTFGLSLADPASTATVPAAGCTGVITLW
jgi:hypothetical protein